MKEVIVFITHKTLGREHAYATFKSLAMSVDPPEIDDFVIYNSHEDDLPTNDILELFQSFEIGYIRNVVVFPYDKNTPKTLASDINAVMQYMNIHYGPDDRVLLLKSDILLSRNFLNETKKFAGNTGDFMFVAPLFNAKQGVSDLDIFEFIQLPYAIMSSEEIFFMEDETRSADTDFRNRPEVDMTDKTIKFISCRVKRDFSCHYMPVKSMRMIGLQNKTWGGSSFASLDAVWVGAYKSFTVHKYHSIKSENRAEERPGEWGMWLAS